MNDSIELPTGAGFSFNNSLKETIEMTLRSNLHAWKMFKYDDETSQVIRRL